jgi:two-component system cell cycle sensor histidine kinase/response regulator CckA
MMKAQERPALAPEETPTERRLRQLIEAASDWFWESDAALRLTYVSPRVESVTGIACASFLGKTFWEVAETAMDEDEKEELEETIAGGRSFRNFLYKQTYQNGYFRYLRVSGNPVRDEAGQLTGYRGVGADVTAEKQAEAKAYHAQERFFQAIDNVAQGIALFDRAGRLITCNPRYRDLYRGAGGRGPVPGMSRAEILRLGFTNGSFLPPEGALDAFIAARATVDEGDHVYAIADGRWMQDSHRHMPDGGSVSLWTDITAIKSAEQKRHELELQLFHSQKLESLGTLAGGIAHDLNNTLVPVLALTKLTARRLGEGTVERSNLEMISEAASKARDLVKQILAFSRKEEIRKTPIDLAALVQDGLRMLAHSLPTSIKVATDIAPVPAILGDAGQISQVLMNLVTNAAHAVGTNGAVSIRLAARPAAAAARPDSVVLSVADDGCGMDETTLSRVFEPFFTTKPVGEGSGLGLAVVHGIIKSHGGEITATSEPGKGSCFEVVFPVARPESA